MRKVWEWYSTPRYSSRVMNAMELVVSFYNSLAGLYEELGDGWLGVMMGRKNEQDLKDFLTSWSRQPWVIRKYLAGEMSYKSFWRFHDRFYQKALRVYHKVKKLKEGGGEI